MKKWRHVPTAIAGALLILVTAAPVSFAQEDESGLSALMKRNRDHFKNVVQVAYFESLDKPLASPDYQRIRQEAESITGIARQVRQNHSRGEEFDELAKDLEEHAQKAAKAAEKEKLPEINVEAGEMAEYCAECHQAYRW